MKHLQALLEESSPANAAASTPSLPLPCPGLSAALELLAELDRRRINIRPEGDSLVVLPPCPEALTPALRGAVLRHEAELISLLDFPDVLPRGMRLATAVAEMYVRVSAFRPSLWFDLRRPDPSGFVETVRRFEAALERAGANYHAGTGSREDVARALLELECGYRTFARTLNCLATGGANVPAEGA